MSWPAHVTLEQLQQAAGASGATLPLLTVERLRWAQHALNRLQRGAVEYGNRSFERPVAELLDELSEETADLGAWAAIAKYALDACSDLEDHRRESVAQALRDVALAGAQAHARIDQARRLLAVTECEAP